MMAKPTGNLVDCVTILIYCQQDISCLCMFENNVLSLPYTKLASANTAWRSQAVKDIKELAMPDELHVCCQPEDIIVSSGQADDTMSASLIRIKICGFDCVPKDIFKLYKIWIPNSMNNFIYNAIFSVPLTTDMKRKIKFAPKFLNKLKWISDIEALKYYNQEGLESQAILEIFHQIRNDPKLEFKYNAPEMSITETLVESTESVFIDTGQKNIEAMLDSSGLKAFQPQIYKEYCKLAYPNVLMPLSMFCKLLPDLGMQKEEATFLFRCADLNDRRFLTFRDFITIMAAVDPNTMHGGPSGELRCRYIFRFFDRDRDNTISYAEMRNVVIYLRKSKGQAIDNVSVDKELVQYTQSLGVSDTKSLPLTEFLKLAGELKIRGLSQLLRVTKSLKSYIQSLPKNGTSAVATPMTITQSVPAKALVMETISSKVGNLNIPYAKGNDFEIAVHTVKIQKSGTMINLEDIWSLPGVASLTTLNLGNVTVEARRLSTEINSQNSICNELIKNLRYLVALNKAKSGNRGNRKEQFVWGTLSSAMFAQKLASVSNSVKMIFKDEPRLLDVRSPLYIMGDFHGNFGDLQYFERMFWPLSPGYCPCSLLFLGDYVDRGPFGVEVICYLFCYKVLYPHKIKLIRGNHEIRDVQKMFTFYSECVSKFGEKLGHELWESINNAFDTMPIAALVDGKIFCCHGGIPPPWLCPVATAINHIPVPLSQPDVQSSLAWEIMWNDPIRDRAITPELSVELAANEGFAQNIKRGTAHVFSCDGLERFLNVNGFTHVIRAHEMVPSGYNVLHKCKLMTIFSTSKYSGQQNEAACILVDHGKLRMMRLDT